MYDIHNHIIPDIDDGAEHLDMSVEMLEMAAAQGISHMVLTPHLHVGRYSQTKQEIYAAFRQLERDLFDRGVHEPQLAVAAEIRFNEYTQEAVMNQEVPYLGQWEGDRVLLLEWPAGSVPPTALPFCQWLRDQRIRPLIAHPERNRDVQKNYKVLKPYVEMGCLFQLTSASIIGRLGDRIQRISRKLVEMEWVHVVASDAHHPIRRPPDLQQGYETLVSWVGSKKAKQFVYDNPRAITKSLFKVRGDTPRKPPPEKPKPNDQEPADKTARASDQGGVFETMAVVNAVNHLDELVREQIGGLKRAWWQMALASALVGGLAGGIIFWAFWVWLT